MIIMLNEIQNFMKIQRFHVVLPAAVTLGSARQAARDFRQPGENLRVPQSALHEESGSVREQPVPPGCLLPPACKCSIECCKVSWKKCNW